MRQIAFDAQQLIDLRGKFALRRSKPKTDKTARVMQRLLCAAGPRYRVSIMVEVGAYWRRRVDIYD